MKFRRKMILAYATVALIASLILGGVVTLQGVNYERTMRDGNLQSAADAYVSQMDETLGRMDAIMNYILSDEAMLRDISLIALEKNGTVPGATLLTAKNELEIRMSTDYIMKNSYRTVFFNQNGYFASSKIKGTQENYTSVNVQRLIDEFEFQEIEYLPKVLAQNGKSVIVAPHVDYWSGDNQVMVFSLMKALRGDNMGALEVECRTGTLSEMENPDSAIQVMILINGKELLYSSEEEAESMTKERTDALLELPEKTATAIDGRVYVRQSSDAYDFNVIVCQSNALTREQMGLFAFAVVSVLFTFGVSLMLVWLWSDLLTRPIRGLQSIVEKTNIQNLSDDNGLAALSREDEFGQLIRAYSNMTKRLNKALQEEKKAVALQLQAQFNMLQAQVNPHFIYNVLNVISSRAVLMGDESICRICGAFGDMLRYSTGNKERYAAIGEELQNLSAYFYLMKERYGNRLSIQVDVAEEIRHCRVPRITLQQLVENNMKYGHSPKDGRIILRITGGIQGNGWYIRIEDDGPGASEEVLEKLQERMQKVQDNIRNHELAARLEIGGMGVINTYARCLLLYGDDLIFRCGNKTEGHGFVVTLGKRDCSITNGGKDSNENRTSEGESSGQSGRI